MFLDVEDEGVEHRGVTEKELGEVTAKFNLLRISPSFSPIGRWSSIS